MSSHYLFHAATAYAGVEGWHYHSQYYKGFRWASQAIPLLYFQLGEVFSYDYSFPVVKSTVSVIPRHRAGHASVGAAPPSRFLPIH